MNGSEEGAIRSPANAGNAPMKFYDNARAPNNRETHPNQFLFYKIARTQRFICFH